jgi:hypothetical protein
VKNILWAQKKARIAGFDEAIGGLWVLAFGGLTTRCGETEKAKA